MTTTIVAIVGASASGKTLLAQTVIDQLNQSNVSKGDLALIQEDGYYRDQSQLTLKQREGINYDHPSAFEHELLLEHLLSLRSGKRVDVPIYDFANHTRSDKSTAIEPAKVIIIEGILLLSDARLRELFDIKLYVDTPLDICLLRRIKRDTEERNRSIDSIIEQYQATVRPMFHEYIEPSKQYADMIVNHGGKNQVAIDMLMRNVRSLLQNG